MEIKPVLRQEFWRAWNLVLSLHICTIITTKVSTWYWKSIQTTRSISQEGFILLLLLEILHSASFDQTCVSHAHIPISSYEIIGSLVSSVEHWIRRVFMINYATRRNSSRDFLMPPYELPKYLHDTSSQSKQQEALAKKASFLSFF
jgi:hypothetical protein